MGGWLKWQKMRSVLPRLQRVMQLFPSVCVVWQNWGDWQHAKPRLCEEIHVGLLLWRATEPPVWLVSNLSVSFTLVLLNHPFFISRVFIFCHDLHFLTPFKLDMKIFLKVLIVSSERLPWFHCYDAIICKSRCLTLLNSLEVLFSWVLVKVVCPHMCVGVGMTVCVQLQFSH